MTVEQLTYWEEEGGLQEGQTLKTTATMPFSDVGPFRFGGGC